MISIKLQKLVKGKKTYPSWSTGTAYFLKAESKKEACLIYYTTKSNRLISKNFPKSIKLCPKFCYILGILKGEGSNSLGKSSYRRFTLTNSDPDIIKLVLGELDKKNLFKKTKIIDKSIHLLHNTCSEEEAINYWSEKLDLPKNKFKCFDDKQKTSIFGVCHVYISDVLLRRIIDLLQEYIIKNLELAPLARRKEAPNWS